jgi:hypothetical protein
MVMSRDQNAGRSHNIQIGNSSFESLEEFKYLGTNTTDQNSVQKEIISRLNLVDVCYYSVQEYFVVQFAIKKIKDKINRTIILLLLLCTGVKLGRSYRGRNVS